MLHKKLFWVCTKKTFCVLAQIFWVLFIAWEWDNFFGNIGNTKEFVQYSSYLIKTTSQWLDKILRDDRSV